MRLINNRILIILCLIPAAALWGSDESEDETLTLAKARERLVLNCADLLSSGATPFEKTLGLVMAGRVDDAISFLKENPLSVGQRLAVWKQLLNEDADRAVELLPEMELAVETKIQTGQLLAQKLGASEAYSRIHIWSKDPDIYFGVLRELSRSMDLGNQVFNFSPDRSGELISNQMDSNFGEGLSAAKLSEFFAASPTGRFSVLVAMARSGRLFTPTGLTMALDDLSDEQRVEIALECVGKAPSMGTWMRDFGIASPKGRARVGGAWAAAHINKTGWTAIPAGNLLQWMNNNFFLDREMVPDMAVEIAKRLKKARVREVSERNEFFVGLFQNNLFANPKTLKAIQREILLRDVLGALAGIGFRDNLDGVHLVAEDEGTDITRLLRELSSEFPDLLPPHFVEGLWDRVKSREAVLIMLNEFFAQAHGAPTHFPEESIDLLCSLTGLKASDVANSALYRNPSIFYELVLDIQKGIRDPAFGGIQIDPTVLNKKDEFLKIVKQLRDLLKFRGDGTKNWKKILHESTITAVGLTPGSMVDVQSRLEQALTEEIKKKLSGLNVSFSYSDFERLEQEWGDIEPVQTLFSRYSTSSSWTNEVPYLLEVFQVSLAGQFETYKFDGIGGRVDSASQNKSNNQTSFLTPQAKAEWRRPRAMVTLINPGAAQGGDETTQNEAVGQAVESNLVPLLQALGDSWTSSKIETESADLAEWRTKILPNFLSGEILHKEPHALIDEFLQAMFESKMVEDQDVALRLAQEAVHILRAPGSALPTKRGAVRVLQSLIAFHPEVGWGEVAPNLKKDLGSLSRLMTAKGGDSEGIVFTVVDASPKFLLTIGDLVQCTSCQNYRTGGQIGTLLGYVIDSNAQGMASFILKQQDFESAGDFNELQRALSEGRQVQSSFRGNRRVAAFTITQMDGAQLSIVSRELGQAFLRQMVKLGKQNSNVPGVRLEREYLQQHPAMVVMRANHETMLQTIENAVGADRRGAITVVGSRNPGGIYTDKGGGTQLGNYNIP
ncbi:MAG: hypothetical protein HYR96_04025 [Deltaproteobacteria bacterium]|nr:hypothetical protein [Deltaproteobacteria bacterium]MBI3295293.1 hypothetical protein [Deltaproteobacteria bacterium]